MFARLKRNGAALPSMGVALICNERNFDRIRKYVQGKDYYGFNQQHVKFLVGFALPIFDQEGEYCFSPDITLLKRSAGTANCAEQLFTSGLYDLWKEKGVEYVYFSGAENLLENPCDPAFLGKMVKEKKKAAIKCVKSQFFG
jgi:UDP-N-acetylglucosamine/UDP-N-acetylgalactosamine diphosphorylase